jgi:hypothetical protein
VTAIVIVLCCVIALLLAALVFARAATRRATERVALGLAHAMADEVKRKAESLKIEIDHRTAEAAAKTPSLTDKELESEINK